MRRSHRTIVFALAAATFLSLLEIFRTATTLSLEGSHASWHEIGTRVLPVWVTLIAVSPWCAFMAGRFPFRERHLLRATVAHVGGAAAFVVLHMLAIGLYGHFFSLARLHHGDMTFGHMYVLHATLEISVYVGIIVILLLLDARREAAERAVAEARLAERLAAARLESLQAQIQPHFLFNTLNALAVLARKGDGAAVDHALVDLGELLRASFDTPGRHEIRLGEELEFLQRYVGLQRLRFPGRLEVEWRIADETRVALVPALLVQPLVENALEHGLATLQGGRVIVAARRDGDVLEIVVSDDGPGFRDGAGGSGGIGLANTRERLSLLYGQRGTLACGNRAEGGGEVRIRLPWRAGEAPGAGA
jgi:two-component system, LytTR family, sensor kinase